MALRSTWLFFLCAAGCSRAAGCHNDRRAEPSRDALPPSAIVAAGSECYQPVPTPTLSKRAKAARLLYDGSLYVHVDARLMGVLVPPEHARNPNLILQLGDAFPKPIPDLRLDKDGFSATLSFHGQPFLCRVPWDAVFALQGERGDEAIWYRNVPPELRCAQ